MALPPGDFEEVAGESEVINRDLPEPFEGEYREFWEDVGMPSLPFDDFVMLSTHGSEVEAYKGRNPFTGLPAIRAILRRVRVYSTVLLDYLGDFGTFPLWPRRLFSEMGDAVVIPASLRAVRRVYGELRWVVLSAQLLSVRRIYSELKEV